MSVDSGLPAESGIAVARAASGIALRRASLTSRLPRRIVPEIDKSPRFIAFVQTLPGRILLVASFALAIHPLGGDPLVALLAAACAYATPYRRYLIPLSTLVVLGQNGFWIDTGVVARVAEQEGVAGHLDERALFAGMLVLVLLLCSAAVHLARGITGVPLLRRSTLCLILFFLGLVLIAQSPFSTGLPRVFLWAFLMAFLPYLWFLAYAVKDAGGAVEERAPYWRYLGFFHPFWGSSLTPFGKGLAYLRRVEAKTPDDLAITQLKGLKLALWSGVLSACLNGFTTLVHGYLAIPLFDEAFARYLGGAAYPWYVCWASLLANFLEDMLNISAWGGLIIACARLAGFRLLRNTYKPLAATTIAEFWNRYYFYYKELMVDFFFYPTFFLCFRSNKKIRLFFATFMAACVGNLLFHFIRDIRFVAELGWWRAVVGDQSHALYTVLLALGIGFSQMRARGRAASRGWLRDRAVPCIRVALFFCVLHVFDAPLDREHTIYERGQFLFHLFGVDRWT